MSIVYIFVNIILVWSIFFLITFFHSYGMLCAAKTMDIRVISFTIGFGKIIHSSSSLEEDDDTIFIYKAVPLYVSVLLEEDNFELEVEKNFFSRLYRLFQWILVYLSGIWSVTFVLGLIYCVLLFTYTYFYEYKV